MRKEELPLNKEAAAGSRGHTNTHTNRIQLLTHSRVCGGSIKMKNEEAWKEDEVNEATKAVLPITHVLLLRLQSSRPLRMYEWEWGGEKQSLDLPIPLLV